MEPLASTDPTHVGRYRLLARLGAGGMGVVYQGEAPDQSLVAVKVIHQQLAADPQFRARFEREVAVCRRVNGLCTARVLHADISADLPFMVTEFIDGPDLNVHLERHGSLPAPQVRALAGGLAEALLAIHGAGLVHRDLKPTNVLLAASGPKVIDFGIAAVADGTRYTSTGLVMGTPGWMAPEQVLGARLEPAMDVFAWGLITAFAGTGRNPFGTGPALAVMYRTLHHEPDLAGLSPQMSELVRAALSEQPAARPTPAQLLAALTGERGTPALRAVTRVLDRDWTSPRPRAEAPTTASAPLRSPDGDTHRTRLGVPHRPARTARGRAVRAVTVFLASAAVVAGAVAVRPALVRHDTGEPAAGPAADPTSGPAVEPTGRPAATPTVEPTTGPAATPASASTASVEASPATAPASAAGGGTNGTLGFPPGASPLVGVQSGKCLDVAGASTANGTTIELYTCTGGPNQAVTVTSAGELRVLGKCLDAFQQGTTDGTAVVLYDCAGTPNQRWTLTSNGQIRGVQSGLCLDATNEGTANGTPLKLFACNGQANQSWTRPS